MPSWPSPAVCTFSVADPSVIPQFAKKAEEKQQAQLKVWQIYNSWIFLVHVCKSRAVYESNPASADTSAAAEWLTGVRVGL